MEVILMLIAAFYFMGQKTVATVRALDFYWLILKLDRIGNEKLTPKASKLHLYCSEIAKHASLALR